MTHHHLKRRSKRRQRLAALQQRLQTNNFSLVPSTKKKDYSSSLRPYSSWTRQYLRPFIFILSSGGLHALIILLALGISELNSAASLVKETGPTLIAVQEKILPPEQETQERPPATKEVLKRPAPTFKKTPPPLPPKKIEPLAPPPPSTIAPTKDVATKRRIVGISFSSTVVGGNGPETALAVGNTLAGTGANVAQDPALVKGLAYEEALKVNKAASNLPLSGVRYQKAARKTFKKPPYPENLKNEGIEGDVEVAVDIDEQGKVTRVQLLKSSNYPEMDEAALKFAKLEEFIPARKNGLAINSSLQYTYRFRLHDI